MKIASIIICIIVMSFAFGWAACGYHIYGGMFNQHVELMERMGEK